MFQFKQCSEKHSNKSTQNQIVIDKQSVVQSQFNPENLICSICHGILWEPVMCNVKDGCHSSFCKTCIDEWVKICQTKLSQYQPILCPNCKNKFVQSSPPPILEYLLNKLKIKCTFYQNGCQEIISYSRLLDHTSTICRYRNKKCLGCGHIMIFRDYESHTAVCPKFTVQCGDCKSHMSMWHFLNRHRNKVEQLSKDYIQRGEECYHFQIGNFGISLQTIEEKLDSLDLRFSQLQGVTNKIVKNEPLQLIISTHTRFRQHFSFPQPTLIKASFNLQKDRNQFLHFYLDTPIYLDSIAGVRWSIQVKKMKGNILLGFCSGMGSQSLDLIVNRHGQVKKKDHKQNKYKLLKRQNKFQFTQRDTIECTYFGLDKLIKIQNITRNCSITLDWNYVQLLRSKPSLERYCMKQYIYAFYSLETLGDKIKFIE